jgi:carbonic anhydrase
VLGCSDSRVPPELLFDQGFGDLFVIRVAGNVLDDDVLGSIEYAAEHLGTPLVAVLGHENCGAVIAAMGEPEELEHLPGELSSLLHHMQERIAEVPAELPKHERVAACVETNARWAAARLRENHVLAERIRDGRLAVVTGVYDLDSGAVRWIESLEIAAP